MCMLCTTGAITMAFTLLCDSELEKFEPVHEITLRSACKLTVDVLEANPRFMGTATLCQDAMPLYTLQLSA